MDSTDDPRRWGGQGGIDRESPFAMNVNDVVATVADQPTYRPEKGPGFGKRNVVQGVTRLGQRRCKVPDEISGRQDMGIITGIRKGRAGASQHDLSPGKPQLVEDMENLTAWPHAPTPVSQ